MKNRFRKGAALLLSFAMLLGLNCVPVSAAITTDGYGDVIASEDFDRTGTWTITNTTGSFSGWTVDWSQPSWKPGVAAPEIKTAPVDAAKHKNAFCINVTPNASATNSNTDIYIATTYAAVGYNDNTKDTITDPVKLARISKVKMEMDVMVGTDSVVGGSIGATVRYGTEKNNTIQKLVEITTDGKFKFNNDNTKVQTYNKGQWYHFVIYLDMSNGNHSVYLNGTEVYKNVKWFAWNNTYKHFLAFRFSKAQDSSKAMKGTFWVDNIKVSGQSAPEFETVSPADNATGFPRMGSKAEFTFSNPLDTTQTITPTITDGTTPVNATATVSGNKVIVTNTDALTADTDYTITVPAGVKDINGKVSAEAKSITVHTAKGTLYSTAPQVVTVGADTVTSATATATVYNEDTTAQKAAMVVAAYDTNGRMIAHDIKTAEVTDNATLTASLSDLSGAEKVYAYVVDGETLSKPLAPSAILMDADGEKELATDCTPTTVTLENFAISGTGEVTVSGSVAPAKKTVVYVNVTGPKAGEESTISTLALAAETETEPSALLPVMTEEDGTFTLSYTPATFVDGKYTVAVGGWQSESQSDEAFCIRQEVQEAIVNGVNDATTAAGVEEALADYKHLLKADDSAFCANGYQTLLEQKPYTTVDEITAMINKAQSLLKTVNATELGELAAVLTNADNSGILFPTNSDVAAFNALDANNQNRVCGFITGKPFASFADLRSALANAMTAYNAIVTGVNGARTADEIKTLLTTYQTGLNEDAALFCDNAYQTLLEQKSYGSVEAIVAMMKKAQTLLNKVNSTNWADLAPILTDDANVGMLFYQYTAIETFAASEEEVQNKICSYMSGDMPFATFAALRTSLTNATAKYKEEQANKEENIQQTPSGGLGGGGGKRPSTSNSSKGNGSGVFYVGGAAESTLPNVTPTPSALPFADMKDAEWAKDYVASLVEKGIVSGDDNGNFRPNDGITREEFVKLLVCALGMEIVESGDNFADVAADAWYARYLATAKAAGIVTGDENGAFGVGQTITRQDMAVMASRALKFIGKSLTGGGATFTDSDAISDYATQAVGQMQQAGILNGVGDGRFAPMDTTSRAASAKVIDMLMNLVIGK